MVPYEPIAQRNIPSFSPFRITLLRNGTYANRHVAKKFNSEKYVSMRNYDHPWFKFKNKRLKELSSRGMNAPEMLKQISNEWHAMGKGATIVGLKEKLVLKIANAAITSKGNAEAVLTALATVGKCHASDTDVPDVKWEGICGAILLNAPDIEKAYNLGKSIRLENGTLFLS